MSPAERMRRIDTQLSHVWMVRTFLKHSEEAEEDEELSEVHRGLYDYMLALGGPLQRGDADAFLRLARKKWARFQRTVAQFETLQPELSTHTNFTMARQSLAAARDALAELLRDEPGTDEQRTDVDESAGAEGGEERDD